MWLPGCYSPCICLSQTCEQNSCCKSELAVIIAAPCQALAAEKSASQNRRPVLSSPSKWWTRDSHACVPASVSLAADHARERQCSEYRLNSSPSVAFPSVLLSHPSYAIEVMKPSGIHGCASNHMLGCITCRETFAEQRCCGVQACPFLDSVPGACASVHHSGGAGPHGAASHGPAPTPWLGPAALCHHP